MNIFDHTILICSCVAELYICHDFSNAFFERRFSKRVQRWTFLILCCSVYAINLAGSANLNLIFAPLALLAYIFCAFKPSILQGIMHYVIIFTSLLGSEFLFVVIANITQPDSAVKLSVIPGLTFIVKLMSFLLLTVVKQFSNRNKERIVNHIFWMYLCLPIASLGMMFSTYFAIENPVENSKIVFALSLSFALVLFGNITVFNAFTRFSEEIYSSMEKEWVISSERMKHQYYTKIVEMNETRKTLIHDFRHYIIALKALIQTGENEEAIAVLKDLNVELEINEKCVFSSIPFLDIVLSEKYSYAKSQDVDFLVKIAPDVTFGNIRKADYTIMMGNLLDNAIQAASRNELSKKVEVNVFMGNNHSFLVSKIRNTYNVEYIQIDNGVMISTKDEAGVHGIGLKSVKETTKRSDGIFTTTIEDEDFVAVLVLPLNIKHV